MDIGYHKRVVMTIGLKQISVCILLIAGIADASASAVGNRRNERDYFMRLFQVQSTDAESGSQRSEPQMQGHVEQRRDREDGPQDSSGNGSQVDNSTSNSPEFPRKQGKLSPEERRALRRQIDEAGHDIYPPRR
jgi:hypothetical protein